MNAGGPILWAELLDERERERRKEWNMSSPRSLLPDGERNVSSCITLLPPAILSQHRGKKLVHCLWQCLALGIILSIHKQILPIITNRCGKRLVSVLSLTYSIKPVILDFHSPGTWRAENLVSLICFHKFCQVDMNTCGLSARTCSDSSEEMYSMGRSCAHHRNTSTLCLWVTGTK